MDGRETVGATDTEPDRVTDTDAVDDTDWLRVMVEHAVLVVDTVYVGEDDVVLEKEDNREASDDGDVVPISELLALDDCDAETVGVVELLRCGDRDSAALRDGLTENDGLCDATDAESDGDAVILVVGDAALVELADDALESVELPLCDGENVAGCVPVGVTEPPGE